MKALVAILLIANVALAAWGLLVHRNRAGTETALMESQLNADKIRIVHGEPEPATPPPAPTRADACVEWGPFSAEELARARAALEPLALGNRLVTAPVSVTAGWWVYLPPQRSRDAAERKIVELKSLGVEESYLVPERGDWENAISLGIFRSEEGAQRFLEALRSKGVRSAIVGSRQQLVRLNTLYLRNPSEVEAQRLVELRAELPGTSVKAAKCP
jgi:hypothetical protein